MQIEKDYETSWPKQEKKKSREIRDTTEEKNNKLEQNWAKQKISDRMKTGLNWKLYQK